MRLDVVRNGVSRGVTRFQRVTRGDSRLSDSLRHFSLLLFFSRGFQRRERDFTCCCYCCCYLGRLVCRFNCSAGTRRRMNRRLGSTASYPSTGCSCVSTWAPLLLLLIVRCRDATQQSPTRHAGARAAAAGAAAGAVLFTRVFVHITAIVVVVVVALFLLPRLAEGLIVFKWVVDNFSLVFVAVVTIVIHCRFMLEHHWMGEGGVCWAMDCCMRGFHRHRLLCYLPPSSSTIAHEQQL
mmetsp:Transcript_9143/g.17923  ORF Transcript_9143/g.17923 Transcript_9143/m.17923 type:complete len:238 (+) Transcript_9143:396-1109(+)